MAYQVRIRNLLRTINMVFKWVVVAEENYTGSWFPSYSSGIHRIEGHLSELFQCLPLKQVNKKSKRQKYGVPLQSVGGFHFLPALFKNPNCNSRQNSY